MKRFLKHIKHLALLFVLITNAYSQEQDSTAGVASPSRFEFNPSFGMTFLSTSKVNEDNENLQWLGKLQSKYSYEGKSLQFNSSLFMQYGEVVTKNARPVKSQDGLILSLTPSMTLINHPAIRLFLETTAETNLGDGMIDKRKTSFADPLFLYQTLFVGQKQFVIQSTDKDNFEITYGLGYAFQQTFTKNFRLDTLQGSQSTFESGLSAIFQIDLSTELGNNFKFKTSLKSIAFSKKDFFKEVNSSRGSILLSSGLYYKVIGIEYNNHLVYDKNISPVRQLEQSLLVTLNWEM